VGTGERSTASCGRADNSAAEARAGNVAGTPERHERVGATGDAGSCAGHNEAEGVGADQQRERAGMLRAGDAGAVREVREV